VREKPGWESIAEARVLKRFCDFADEPKTLDGEKVRLDDILNREIAVTGFNVKKSKYSKNASGKYLTLQFQIDGSTKVFFSGSDVLIGQVERYEKEIPFITVIKKINRYYTMS
jgi:hypothetical protein